MLSNLQACSPDHKGMLEFMCYGNEKSYCKGCYKKHKNTCASSRCGDAKKLCYAILEKVEYYKLKARLLDANLSLAEYNDLKDAFGNIYLNFTNLLKVPRELLLSNTSSARCHSSSSNSKTN
jgi:predicted Fe-S protein YdhL (DUF1289 family)